MGFVKSGVTFYSPDSGGEETSATQGGTVLKPVELLAATINRGRRAANGLFLKQNEKVPEGSDIPVSIRFDRRR